MSTEVKKVAGVMRQVADSWSNVLSGLGSRRDKGNARFAVVCPSPFLDRATLAEAYRSMWLVRRVINAVPDDATRRGYGEGNAPEDRPEFTRLNHARYAEGALLRACNLGRLMGGAGVYIGYANGGADTTLPAAAGAQVAFLEVFHRFEIQAVESSRVKDTADPRHGQPDLWQVIGQNRTGLTFHHTRMVNFPGQSRADDFEQTSAQDRDWWDSILQSLWEDLIRYGMFWQGVSHLMQISSVGVLKIKGLIAMLASKNVEDAEARIDLLNEALSLTRLMMLDADGNEEYSREAVSFSDVPALLQELQMATAGAVNMPVTKLFGRAPAGMNATGESDTTNWYDSVDTWRETVLKPRAEALMSACEGTPVTITWPSLWEPSEKEQAEVEQLRATTAQVLWTMGVATEDEVRAAIHDGVPLADKLVGAAPEPPEPTAPTGGFEEPVDDTATKARTLLDSVERLDVSAAWAQDRSIEKRVERARQALASALDAHTAREASFAVAEAAHREAEAHANRAEQAAEASEEALQSVYAERVERRAAGDKLTNQDPDLVGAQRDALAREAEHVKARRAEGKARRAAEKAAPSDDALDNALQDLDSEYEIASQTASEPAKRAEYKAAAEKVRSIRQGGSAEVVSSKEAAVRVVQQGPRGGSYYVSVGGGKVYV